MDDIIATSRMLYDNLPNVDAHVFEFGGFCGEDETASMTGIYCTSTRDIYVPDALRDAHLGPYYLAHLLAHGIFVEHGLADVALAAIQANRADEAYLRGQVTRQIECLAGLLYAKAGLLKTDLRDHLNEEPFTNAHWGRTPVARGPKVSIGLDARADWFLKGQAATRPIDCAVPELPAELLERFYRR